MFRTIHKLIWGSVQRPPRETMIRNLVEFSALALVWIILSWWIQYSGWSPFWLTILLLAIAWGKTLFFGVENIQQLLVASRHNTPYYQFMIIVLVNMTQFITSFAFDYHCLHQIQASSFGGVNPALNSLELVFEYFYYSVLTFTFFGYGDITPQAIPAKLLTITEILVAFSTVIFLLSDFISLKESVSRREED